ncbi:amidohydrolase family protein [Chondromyces crocatus]|uniref:Amidohydrolase n=1 Tax=Chondromyces crocatus TaxID=52 RepID=A0A0K1E9U0_CHOCO|nr:amidohydrolase family protein [Chondromyces crocatus]AKT37630.1 amidohydrolase [Chondromyces crocatus]
MIIDAHAHVSPTSYGSAELYLQQLAQGGIAQGVVSPGGMLDVRQMGAYISGQLKPDLVPKNEYVDWGLGLSGGLHGFACVDPCTETAPETLERYLRQGFRGLMVTPLVHKFSFGDDVLAPLMEVCAAHGATVCSHVAFRPGANTADYVRLAERHPNTPFILEHMGAGPADSEATAAATRLDNLYLETSLGSYLHIAETVKRAGASKVIFGSEFPLSHPVVELQKLLLLPISSGERDKILGGNIRHLLRIGCS